MGKVGPMRNDAECAHEIWALVSIKVRESLY